MNIKEIILKLIAEKVLPKKWEIIVNPKYFKELNQKQIEQDDELNDNEFKLSKNIYEFVIHINEFRINLKYEIRIYTENYLKQIAEEVNEDLNKIALKLLTKAHSKQWYILETKLNHIRSNNSYRFIDKSIGNAGCSFYKKISSTEEAIKELKEVFEIVKKGKKS